MGHLSLLGLRSPVMPWSTDGPGEAEIAGTMESTLSDWADRCHDQGGTVIVPHFPVPNGELAALVATGRVDAVEMHRHSAYRHLEYYRVLNAGYPLPLAGGTDKMTSGIPVGLYRTYVRLQPGEEFSFDSWRRNLRLGRSFITSGPMLDFTVDGAHVGDTLYLPPTGGAIEIEAVASSTLPIHTLEIVQQGQVVASTQERNKDGSLSISTRVQVQGSSWFAARVGGPEYLAPVLHHDDGDRGIFAHSSPIYVACGNEWQMLDIDATSHLLKILEGSMLYLRSAALWDSPGSVTHHHGEDDHLAYLERPLIQARDALLSRIAGASQ
jgi:hypothetical protein